MTRAPLVTGKSEKAFARGDRTGYDTTLGWRFPNPRLEAMFPLESMGETGENVAERWGVSREDQDAFALESQRRWAAADAAGRFADELVAVGDVIRDEHPRPEATGDQLSGLRPAFRQGGTVTAGNSSGINDGAAAVVVASADRAAALGIAPLARFAGAAVVVMSVENAQKRDLKPLGRIVNWGIAGVDPKVMGRGPVPATKLALQRAGLTLDYIDLIEVNEAFAAQYLAVEKELGLDRSKVNVNGGAIALGHPLGATGTRLVITLLYELKRRKKKYGLATACIGGGQGIAMVVESFQ